jgi:DNA-binding FadR family transcriptional regulator
MERLEEEFSVSRSVLREAVRVLSAKGLVEARPKRGTIVCPSSRWNLLDPYVMVWKVNTGIPDEQYLQSWEQVRWIIEPQAVRMAATHRTEEDLVGMRLILNELADSMARDDIECYIAADLSFHHALLVATCNQLLVQLGAITEEALGQRDSLVYRGRFGEAFDFDHHHAVYSAIRDGDEDAAEQAMRALLAQSSALLGVTLASEKAL